jgi:MOSC domain-containing protein YiiM
MPKRTLVISVNTGLPRDVTWRGRIVTTGIFKQPVEGRVAVTTLNLEGDRQADLSVHGGQHKAVYCYPIEHYDYWKKELPGRELPMAVFGENFTTAGLTEDYVAVSREGEVGAGDEIAMLSRDPNGVTVSEITRLYVAKAYNPDAVASIRRALQVDALPESWKDYFRERLSA